MSAAAELLRRVRAMARERYAWPGGYALALVTTDGGILCPDCVRAEYWEGPELCDHCGASIGGAE